MKIQAIRENYEETTGVVSELVRKLAFAGIGIVWILRIGEGQKSLHFPEPLIAPLLLLVATLAADLLQYVTKAAVLWGLNTYFWIKYRDESKDVRYSGWWNALGNGFFVIKVILVMLAYWWLFRALDNAVLNVRSL